MTSFATPMRPCSSTNRPRVSTLCWSKLTSCSHSHWFDAPGGYVPEIDIRRTIMHLRKPASASTA